MADIDFDKLYADAKGSAVIEKMPKAKVLEGLEPTSAYPGTQIPANFPRIVLRLTWPTGKEDDVVVDETWENVWGPKTSGEPRWPYLQGRLLWEMHRRHYFKEESATQQFYPAEIL